MDVMRVLVAPDKFAGTLTAVEAVRAIADGWIRQAPEDTVDLAPMADGGPGFVDVLHEALGGELSAVTVSGPPCCCRGSARSCRLTSAVKT